MGDREWDGSTFGNGWMHRSLVSILRFTDVRILYLFTGIFIVPFCILFWKGGRISFGFYRRRMGFGILKSLYYTWRNHIMFSQVVIDRFAMYAGKNFEIETEGRELFDSLAERKEGFIQLSSHIGNYEIAGYSLHSDKKAIHAVVYSHEKESVMKSRNDMFVKTNVSMIAIRKDMSHLLEIDRAICDGDIVSFPTDRHMEGAKCIRTDFLGSPASFPQGPFSVATMRGNEVLAVNVMKTGTRKYKIHLKHLACDRTLPRKEQIASLCEEYVSELERMVRMYPEQWYNFFDFWK